MRQGIPVPRWPAFPEKPKGESSIADSAEVHHHEGDAARSACDPLVFNARPIDQNRDPRRCCFEHVQRVSSALRETCAGVRSRARGV